MKIDPRVQSTELQNASIGNAKSGETKLLEAQSTGANSVSSGDTVQLSGKANQTAQLASQVAHLPEVRADRVAAYQSKLERGTYAPDSGKVADAILAEQGRGAAQG